MVTDPVHIPLPLVTVATVAALTVVDIPVSAVAAVVIRSRRPSAGDWPTAAPTRLPTATERVACADRHVTEWHRTGRNRMGAVSGGLITARCVTAGEESGRGSRYGKRLDFVRVCLR